jgi:hypothetical protein
MTRYIAIDLGAESGRVMLGRLEGDQISLEEIHRFPNRSYARGARLFWDFAHLEREIFAGVKKAASLGEPIHGISTDSWAVDYVLLDGAGTRLGDPHCYRDPWTASATKRVIARVPFAEIYRETGIQFLPINTIYQIEAQQAEEPDGLAQAGHFLMIADYFNAQFSGVEVVDASNASTTQLYEPRAGRRLSDWRTVAGLRGSVHHRAARGEGLRSTARNCTHDGCAASGHALAGRQENASLWSVRRMDHKILHRKGSVADLPLSIRPDNLLTLLNVGLRNIDLVRYLMQQGTQSMQDRLNVLHVFYPAAKAGDWKLVDAGIRVQAIKKTDGKAGIVHYGTEVTTDAARSISALLGASPGAFVSVNIVLQIINLASRTFWQERMDTSA